MYTNKWQRMFDNLVLTLTSGTLERELARYQQEEQDLRRIANLACTTKSPRLTGNYVADEGVVDIVVVPSGTNWMVTFGGQDKAVQ